MHAVNTESVFLKPQAIRHLFDSSETVNEESKNEESKESSTAPPRKESEE